MTYYQTNAVYKRLEDTSNSRLIWVAGDAWILVYADERAYTKAIVFVEGTSMRGAGQRSNEMANRASGVARDLSIRTKVPFATIQFDNKAPEIATVLLDGNEITLTGLKSWFAESGLQVSKGVTEKAINSQSSSAYHDWQRNNLGNIKVSDVDLIRLSNDDMMPIEIIELKRSFYSLDRWKPYTQDYANFNVISNLTDHIDARFTIAYNVRTTSPFKDDASELSLFAYSKADGSRPLGKFSFDEFAAGSY